LAPVPLHGTSTAGRLSDNLNSGKIVGLKIRIKIAHIRTSLRISNNNKIARFWNEIQNIAREQFT